LIKERLIVAADYIPTQDEVAAVVRQRLN